MKLLSGICLACVMLVCAVSVALPSMAHAQSRGNGLIPCGNTVDPSTGGITDECTFNDLLKLGKNVINYLIALAIPLAAISFTYAGFLYITAVDNPKQVEKARSIFFLVLKGFLLVLSAWLIVYTIVSLLDQSFSLLK